MKINTSGPLIGAAFLMATSAIGPGFLTQTTVFTQSLGAAFGFAILVSVVLDIVVQLNVWRVICIAGRPAQTISNLLFPGLGHLLTVLIVFGGLAFNIGNLAGAGLALQVLFGWDVLPGTLVSCFFAIGVFLVREATVMMDRITRLLGLLMIALTVYVAWKSAPPLQLAVRETFVPGKIDFIAILTIVGGTVGGYITFAGAHRLLDAGVHGPASMARVTGSAVTAISLASLMRILLFLGALGVVVSGATINPTNPAASVFSIAAGPLGYKLFGIVLWAAAITSVIGSAYTSVSFIPGFGNAANAPRRRWITVIFILTSAIIFAFIGQPVKVLILAGTLNGLVLPFSLTIMLIAGHRASITGSYRHPGWLTISGIIVIGIMSYMGFRTIMSLIQPVA